MNRKSYSLKKPSNRARMRAATAAVKRAVELEAALESTIQARNGLHASLCSVLAQKGGEVTITPGTMQQLMNTRMGFMIVPGPGETEFTLRLVEEPTEGDANVADDDDHTDDGSGVETATEDEVAPQAEDLRGLETPVQGD